MADEHVRVVHVSCYVDPASVNPERLLDAWPWMVDVAAALARTGVEVAVVQAGLRNALHERHGVEFHFVADREHRTLRRRMGLWARPLPRRLGTTVAQLQPDLVHFHSLSMPRHVRFLAKRLLSVPIMIQDHADRPPPRWRRGMTRRAFSQIAGIAFTAREQAKPFFETGVLSRDVPIFEVLEASSSFTPGNQSEARARTGLYGDPILLWVGRLNWNKDPLTVIEALRLALTSVPDAHLWCCYTDAKLEKRVRERVAGDRNLASRVRLLGAVSHETVQDLCRAADFLVLGSHREAAGGAVIEAMACGLTPLVTDIPSFRRITRNGSVGALSPPGDVHAMARAITLFAARDRAALRTTAREHFNKYMSFDVIAHELIAAYGSLLEVR